MTMTERATHISHPEHELERKNYQKPYTCDGCKQKGFGARYRCELCNYDLHEDCMFPTLTTTHEFFKGCTFKFIDHPPREWTTSYCDACGKEINGFVYHCETKGWDLHPCCHNLKNKLSIDGTKFRLRDEVSSKCIWCNKRRLEDTVKGIRGWSYVSKCEKYHFHVYCATEMVLSSWKDGSGNNNDCLALENLELPIQVQRNRNGRGSKLLRIVKVFLKTLACILLGDPTITLTCLLLELASK
ncbi:hypothetical protein L1049_011557 [Liquidambar formosana]|uniref:Phorbol-ester/DAG-type domain-containing protein n=1 Tax=Liquidambar formosana TaxID=63359 RepID=A0AAP0RS95_LIQFO